MTFSEDMASAVQHFQPQSPGNLLDEGSKTGSLCNQIEERSSQSCRTSFPVNLKEVFELTSPNSDLNQSLMRQTTDIDGAPPAYSPSPEKQQSQNGISESGEPKEQLWSNSMLDKLEGSEAHASSSQLPHSSWPNVFKDGSSEQEKLMAQSVINLSVSNDRVSYDQGASPQSQGGSQNNQGAQQQQQQMQWSQVATKSSSEENFGNKQEGNNNGNHIVNNVSMNNYLPSHISHCNTQQAAEEGKQQQLNVSNQIDVWNYPQNPMDRSETSILNASNNNNNDNNAAFAKRDASCQVDDVSLPLPPPPHNNNYQTQPMQPKKGHKRRCAGASSAGLMPQSLLNLTVATGSHHHHHHHHNINSQVLIHSGIKPELYTQEHNLVIESRVKDASMARKSGSFSCHRCPKTFGDSRSLQRHMMVHAGLRTYRCGVCDKGFMLKGDLTRHLRIHSGEKPFVCEVCGRRFTLKGNLMQHFRTHSPDKQYTCTICSKNYAQKDSLHRHIRAHFGEKPFQCTSCGKKFTLKGDLSRHILIHSGVKPHSCKFCGKLFALKGNLTQHMRTHIKPKVANNGSNTDMIPSSLDNQKCSNEASVVHNHKTQVYEHNVAFLHCVPNSSNIDKLISPASLFMPATSSNHGANSNNTNQLQSADLSFCSACSKTFSSPESLQDHVQLVHEQSTRLPTNRYLCNICQKEFTLKGDLNRHLNSHNGVKPYQCEHCEKTFTLKSNLRQHMTTHTSSKSFPCPLCSKLFGNRRNLSLHLRRHEQASANFTCTKCGRSFLAKSDHFFHNCVKVETSSSSADTPVIRIPAVSSFQTASSQQSSPPAVSSAIYSHGPAISDGVSEVSQSSSGEAAYVLAVKREAAQMQCSSKPVASATAESLAVVNGGGGGGGGSETFMSPFYRHLYFATSHHQSMLPSLKGFLNSQTEANSNISDSNKPVKAN